MNLDFSHRHSYASHHAITVPLRLSSGQQRVSLLADVDTGASHCIFERKHAEVLELDVESGDPRRFRTATGYLNTFGHLVSIEVLGLRFESVVYFLGEGDVAKNLLGRSGWFDRLCVGLVHHDSLLYLAEYGSGE